MTDYVEITLEVGPVPGEPGSLRVAAYWPVDEQVWEWRGTLSCNGIVDYATANIVDLCWKGIPCFVKIEHNIMFYTLTVTSRKNGRPLYKTTHHELSTQRFYNMFSAPASWSTQ